MSNESNSHNLPDSAQSDTSESTERTEVTAGRECPHCACRKIHPWGAARGLPRYRCSACTRTFIPLTNTNQTHQRNKDKKKQKQRTKAQQKSIRKSAESCGVDNTTVLRW